MLAVGEGEVGLGIASVVSLTRGRHQTPHVTVDGAAVTALILYTGGTTGLPKRVTLTHRSLMAKMSQLDSGDVTRDDDILVAVAPSLHAVGLNAS